MRNILIAIGSTFVITGILFFTLTGRSAAPQAVAEASPPPVEAVQLNDLIVSESKRWTDAQQKEIDAENALKIAREDRQKAEDSARGLRLSLCTRFGYLSNEGALTQTSSSTDCEDFR